MLGINWTTVISSAVVACIIGGFQLIANRYTTRLLDRIVSIHAPARGATSGVVAQIEALEKRE